MTDWCTGTGLAGSSNGTGQGQGSPADNYAYFGVQFASDAPAECQGMFESGFDTGNMEYCADPLSSILSGCPYNGGNATSVCGSFYLQTVPIGGVAVVGNPSIDA